MGGLRPHESSCIRRGLGHGGGSRCRAGAPAISRGTLTLPNRREAMPRLALGAMLAAGLLSAQTKPDFSGTWTLVSSDSPAADAGVKTVVVVLTQTDRILRRSKCAMAG